LHFIQNIVFNYLVDQFNRLVLNLTSLTQSAPAKSLDPTPSLSRFVFYGYQAIGCALQPDPAVAAPRHLPPFICRPSADRFDRQSACRLKKAGMSKYSKSCC
jgi:hypothetical protein